ncbi:MAG TPA: molybdopterin cofactor-binding domain-containing protein [Chitinophagaceae bacterium]|jgi:isoquinoline 1-oxidoreductase|nr:molybdopterin cofactor-binding domain-containing protein [Chitinophagaceae bacterium]
MEDRGHSQHPFEPTRDELPVKSNYHFDIDRRKFFKIAGGGLIVAFVVKDLVSFADISNPAEPSSIQAGDVDAWIHIGKDGTVTVYTGKVEVGQNIRTSLSQIVSEELMVPVASVTMIMGDTDLVPYDAGTFGSRTTPQMGTQLRKAAATARQALIEMAAKKWNTQTEGLKIENGMVVNTATNQRTGYGELTNGQRIMMTISDAVPVIGAKDWKVAGKSVPKVDQRNFISGKHIYVSDMKLPNMLYGKVLRAPSYGSKLIDADLTMAKNIPGVIVVKDGDFIGVAAPDVKTATKALQSINAKWEEKQEHPSNSNIFEYLLKNPSGETSGRNQATTTDDVERGLSEADFKHAITYNIHYIAHVPLEPRAAVAEWVDGKLTVWTGTQRPFGVQEELAEVFRTDKKNIRVIMPDTGSGYGGKHSGETAIEAARLAKEAKKPVKIIWTREEEFTWAYFRPGGVIEVSAGVKKDGNITAWKFINYNSGGAGLDTQYKVGNKQVAHVRSNSPLRQGSYRGLAATANVFARECHMDDLARLIKMDPLTFRIKNLQVDRLITVLKSAAEKFGWNGSKPTGHGHGLACGFEKGGYVGTCAEIKVNDDKEVKIVRVTQAFECGAIINPHHLENQVMGSIIQALGGALFEAVEFANGKILNSSLSAYRVPRFSDIPKIEIVLIDRKDLPSSGAGEAAIIGIAPAIRNAIVDATGKALNILPMLPSGLLA